MMSQLIIKIASKFIVISCLTMFLFSCSEKREDIKLAATENAIAQMIFNDIINQVDKTIQMSFSGNKNIQTICPQITILPAPPDTTFPKILTIDYGENCSGANNIIRSGIIKVTISGPYKKTGTTILIELENYKQKSNIIKGSISITNAGKNNYNNTIFNIIVKNGHITTDDGIIEWSAIQQREWFLGENTSWPLISDDIYRTTGESKGMSKDGKNFKTIIMIPLVNDHNCQWIFEGSFNITTENIAGKTFDFGKGNCDNKATLTFKNKVYNITLD